MSPATSPVAIGVSRIPGALRSLARHGTHLAGEAVSVLTGGSPAAPVKADKRFRDPTFADNPVYRIVMQLYLVWCAEVSSAVEEADLNWRDKELVRFVTGAITSSASPTNVLLGNPAALKRAFETGGASLVLGMRNRLHDLRHNAGAPAQYKRGALRVGEQLAVTPGAVVYRDDVCEVLQYRPTTDTVRERPVLLVPPQIGRYYFMDLAPDRSFVEHAVAQGIPFFLVSWKDPGPDQREWNLDVYAASLLQVIDAVREISGSDDVNLLGLCAGGILTSIILAHLAETGDERVHSAAFGVTLLDFDEPTPIGMFNQGPIVRQARRRSSGAGTLDPRSLATVFNWMRPNDLVWNYWVNNYLLGQDPPVFDILAWNADGTSLPAALHHQFLKLFNLNLLAKGELHVLGHRIDLAKVTIDTYATGATTDHLTPWKGCYRTARLMSGTTTFVLSNAGHIASLVNPPGNPKAHYFTGPEPGEDPEEWRAQATEVRGTWWEHWAAWVIERSGDEVPAPEELGSAAHPVLDAAPGRYVREHALTA